MARHFYRINVKELNGTQEVLVKSETYGLYRNLLGADCLTLHQLAGKIKSFKENFKPEMQMPTQEALGHALLRLVQEGLVGLAGAEQGPLIKFKKLHELAQLPTYSKPGDAGCDVRSVIEKTIYPGQTAIIPLGFSMEIEKGWEVQVRPRSGLAAKNSVTVLNAPGTIDSGYRGEVMVILHNASHKKFVVNVGDRIAQFVVKRAPQATLVWADEIAESERGEGGLGSTGVK